MNKEKFSKITKQHKKMLEKKELYTYSFTYKGKKYFQCLYYRFQQTTGILIIDEHGDLAESSIAKQVAYYMNDFNTLMLDVTRVAIPERDKSYAPIEEKYQLLKDILANGLEREKSDILENYLTILEDILEKRGRIPEIIQDISLLYDQVLSSNELTLEIYDKVNHLSEEFNEIMFWTAMKLTETIPMAKEVQRGIRSNDVRFRKLKQLVNDFLAPSSLNNLQESVELLMVDENGRRHTISANSEGVEIVKELKKRKRQFIFQKDIAPIIRNAMG